MRKLLSYLKPYRGKIALATLLMAISAVCDLLLPTLMSDVLDKGVYGAAEADTFGYILKTAAWMLLLSLASLASVAGGYWVVYRVVSGYTWSLRSALFRKVHTMTLAEVGRIGASNLVTRSTHDVETLTDVISMLCGGILIIPLMFLGGVFLCMRKDVTLSLVILCAVPLLIGAGMLMSKRIEHLWEVSDEYCDKQNDLVRERLRGIRVIRAFDREKHAHERITDATRTMADNIIRANVRMEIIDPAAAFVLNGAALLVVFLGGVRMEQGSGLTAGDEPGHRFRGPGERRPRAGEDLLRSRRPGPCQLHLSRQFSARSQRRGPPHKARRMGQRHRRHRLRQNHPDGAAPGFPRPHPGERAL